PQVVGGGSLDRPVRWVHVSDVADLSGLLQGGELVLTTGGPLADPDACTRYLGGLFAAGAAGVVVELGTSLQAIPSGVAREADKLQLPVIALHRKIRFVDVTEQVHRSIVAEQYDEVAFARHVHEVFTE
ncbi:PucR family transcriptional regulator ligand-binding domain-containing protein, partial [Mycobacteroides abscessus]